MYKTLLIGYYDPDGYGRPLEASVAVFESDIEDPEELKKKIVAVVKEHLAIQREEDGWEMQYSYNFGDIVEELYDPGIVADLEERGIRYVPADPELRLAIFEHDEILIDEDEINI